VLWLTLSTRRANCSKLPTCIQPSEAALGKVFEDNKMQGVLWETRLALPGRR
jgi:hypothetical protein